MIDIDIDTNTRGPLWRHSVPRLLEQAADEIEDEAGEQGIRILRTEFNRVLRKQTPYYVTRLRSRRVGGDVVLDNPVIYSAWLEGTGSRNAPVTRFAGYHVFARTARRLDVMIRRIGDRVIGRLVRRLNG